MHNALYAQAEAESCLHERFVLAVNTAGVVELVEQRCKVNGIACYLCRVIIPCGSDYLVRQRRKMPDKLLFLGLFEQSKLGNGAFSRRFALRGKLFENTANSCVGILAVINGIL